MRNKLYFLPVFVLLIVTGCNKDASSRKDSLTGAWELRSWYGGYSATGGGNVNPGNGNIYAFTENTYRYYVNNTIQDSGTYSIIQSVNPNTGEPMQAILMDSAYTMPYSVDKNTLTLYNGPIAADGTVSKYAKITGVPSGN
jgi:hypothetical protein